MYKKEKKCTNCKGKGFYSLNEYKHECLYCRGKGFRNRNYGRDKI